MAFVHLFLEVIVELRSNSVIHWEQKNQPLPKHCGCKLDATDHDKLTDIELQSPDVIQVKKGNAAEKPTVTEPQCPNIEGRCHQEI